MKPQSILQSTVDEDSILLLFCFSTTDHQRLWRFTTSTSSTPNPGALLACVPTTLLSRLTRRLTSVTEASLTTLLSTPAHSDRHNGVTNQPRAWGALGEQLLSNRSKLGLHPTVGEGVPGHQVLAGLGQLLVESQENLTLIWFRSRQSWSTAHSSHMSHSSTWRVLL